MAVDSRQVEAFVYYEARLMDEHRYDEWEALWTDDATYWVPCNDDDADPTRNISIIYDERRQIGMRVQRLKSGMAHAQDPTSRMRRVVSNIGIEEEENGEITVASNFILVELRRHHQNIWTGRTVHRLRREGASLKMASKKVMLINNDEELPNLAFLI